MLTEACTGKKDQFSDNGVVSPVTSSGEAFNSCIGKRLQTVLINALPGFTRTDHTTTFVFEDGTGLSFNTDGLFWIESQHNVGEALKVLRSLSFPG